MTTVFNTVRHPHRGGKGGRPYLPAHDAAAIVEGRTIYTSTVRDPDEGGALLKSGHNNGKIGRAAGFFCFGIGRPTNGRRLPANGSGGGAAPARQQALQRALRGLFQGSAALCSEAHFVHALTGLFCQAFAEQRTTGCDGVDFSDGQLRLQAFPEWLQSKRAAGVLRAVAELHQQCLGEG